MPAENFEQLINPKSLRSEQLRLLKNIAQHLRQKPRGRFLKTLFERIVPQPTDAEFLKAVSEQLEALE